MGAHWLTDLPDVIERAGLDVDCWPGWESRSRSSGGYDQVWAVFAHHTASSTSLQNDCSYMWDSTSGDQPIGAIYLDRSGLVVVGAAGATNCQGKGGPCATSHGTIPLDKGNAYGIAIEAGNNGVGEAWPAAQQAAYTTLCAALCDAYDLDPLVDVVAHFEWTARKVDPAGPSAYATGAESWDMDSFRGDVIGEPDVEPPEPEPPTPTPTESEDRMLGLVRLDSNPNAIYVVDGINARKVRSDEVDELTSNLQYDTGFRYYDLTSAGRPQIRDINKIPKRPDDQIQLWGVETTESTTQPG
jgi:hypothetical protein